ncbi:MAG: sulfite exporter TauE/SafE family protein, partial [Acidimicrobiia bacterium]|nr:sulfite exporter TauE/SafE family protein [Acidimicrobiia bacterium]
PILVRVVSAGIIGVAGGTYLLTVLDDRILSIALAISVFLYIVLALARPDVRLSRDRGLRIAAPVGVVGGFMHGATGNSGMVFGTYLHALDLPRREFVFAVTIPFLAFGTVQVFTLAGLGGFDGARLVQALFAILPVLVVTPLGSRIGDRLKTQTFSRLVLALLALSGVFLIAAAI